MKGPIVACSSVIGESRMQKKVENEMNARFIWKWFT